MQILRMNFLIWMMVPLTFICLFLGVVNDYSTKTSSEIVSVQSVSYSSNFTGNTYNFITDKGKFEVGDGNLYKANTKDANLKNKLKVVQEKNLTGESVDHVVQYEYSK